MQDIAQKIIKPNNCVLAFGIPTTLAGFEYHRDGKHGSDFIRKFARWAQYSYQVVEDADRVVPVLARCGVTVARDLTRAKFKVLFAEFDVVILFSHWQKSAVEFYDGLADVPSVVECVPDNFSGMLDLCVCHPDALAMALRVQRPNCLIKYIPVEATPYRWLYFYLRLFERICQEDITYLEAIEKTVL